MTREDEEFPRTSRFLEGRLRHAMSAQEKQVLEDLVDTDYTTEGETTVLQRGERSDHSTLLVDGFVLRTGYRNGDRTIVGVHVPGDFVDLHNFALQRLDHDIVAIGRSRLATVPHSRLREVMDERPRLSRILWFASLLDAAIHRVWIMKLEQLRADGRIAHLFAEVWRRLEMVRLARPDGFASPLGQAELADMCGISIVHANRSLRILRTEGLAQFRRGRVFVDDRAALERHARFHPDYLYGEGQLQMLEALDVS